MLFADLTGFTSLAEGLDPETLRAFQNALFETLAQAVAHYDGFVEKFVGDAVMAVFGAPRAHEDDPVRAIDAALAMLAGVDELSRAGARLARPVTLHIGVHTGAVVAGSLGSGAGGSYAVTGDTVNTASRLLNAAEPGTVLVSAATQALARHRFDFAPPAELALRGKAQPMQVYRVLGVRGDAASPRGLAELGLVAPLVGREAALGQLLHAFDGMQAGRGATGAGDRRGRCRQVAPAGRVLRPAGEWTARAPGRHQRAPQHLLLAGRADLRHLRRAVSRRLPGRARATRWRWRSTSCRKAWPRWAPAPTRPMRWRGC